MIRSCGSCKALEYQGTGLGHSCNLGNKVVVTKKIDGISVAYRPESGECQKPKNNAELVSAMMHRINSKG